MGLHPVAISFILMSTLTATATLAAQTVTVTSVPPVQTMSVVITVVQGDSPDLALLQTEILIADVLLGCVAVLLALFVAAFGVFEFKKYTALKKEVKRIVMEQLDKPIDQSITIKKEHSDE